MKQTDAAGFTRRWTMVLIALLAAGGVIWWFLEKPRIATPPKPTPPISRSLNVPVMTFNVNMIEPTAGADRWSIQRRLFPKIIDIYKPDLIGLQACTPVQAAWLADHLRNYRHYPVPRGLANGIFSAISGAISTWNQIFYSTRFSRIGAAHGLVRPGDLRNNATENAYYSLVVLRDRAGTLPDIILLDTHLRHGNANAAVDAGLLHAIVHHWRRKFPHALSIVLGDMNHTRTDFPVYSRLIGPLPHLSGDHRWSDTFDYTLRPKGHAWGTVQYYVGRPGLPWPSDLIFVGSAWTWTPAKIIRFHGPHGNYPSDHFPVFTVLTPAAAPASRPSPRLISRARPLQKPY